jgi:hypothetical protein
MLHTVFTVHSSLFTVQSNSQAKNTSCVQNGVKQQRRCKWSKHIGNTGLCVVARYNKRCILLRDCNNGRYNPQNKLKSIRVERRMFQPAIVGHDLTLTAHFQVVSRLRMSGVIPLINVDASLTFTVLNTSQLKPI